MLVGSVSPGSKIAVGSCLLAVVSVDFLLMPFLVTGFSWPWWKNRKTEAGWWHRVEER